MLETCEGEIGYGCFTFFPSNENRTNFPRQNLPMCIQVAGLRFRDRWLKGASWWFGRLIRTPPGRQAPEVFGHAEMGGDSKVDSDLPGENIYLTWSGDASYSPRRS